VEHPPFASFTNDLVAKGKAKKVAIVACMRKLLTILNAMVKHGALWKTTELAEEGI
jgi:transposase